MRHREFHIGDSHIYYEESTSSDSRQLNKENFTDSLQIEDEDSISTEIQSL